MTSNPNVIGEHLRMDALDSMSTVEFPLAVEEEFKLKISSGDASRISTLRDLTNDITERLPSPPKTGPLP